MCIRDRLFIALYIAPITDCTDTQKGFIKQVVKAVKKGALHACSTGCFLTHHCRKIRQWWRASTGHGPYRRGDVVATSFKETVADDDDSEVAGNATVVAKSKFSERLLRDILDSAVRYYRSDPPCWIWSAASTRCKAEPQNQAILRNYQSLIFP